MDLQHKHGAIIWTGVLALIFVGLLVWYMVTSPSPVLPPTDYTAATSTPTFVEPAPEVITEEGAYYEITAELPSLTPLLEPANQAVVSTLRTFSTDRIAEFKRNGDFANITPGDAQFIGLGDGRKYVLGLEYELYTSSQTISYLYTIYEDTLGAHPNAYFRTFTFNAGTGTAISLSDLFIENSNYLTWLSERTRRDIPLIIQQRSGYMPDTEYLKSGTEPNPESFQNFYLEGNTLVLAFPPYQVGPYALGSVFMPIPLSDMESILRPEYLP